MSWLRRLFAFGRLKREPPGHNAGRLLPPASVQRSHLGLSAVDLASGVVTVRGGEVRAILRVSGVPLHHRSPEDTRAFLVGWATALNALPPDVAWVMRSRPGGLAAYLREKDDQAAALARQAPGSGLARLAADQLAHAQQLHEQGGTRRNDAYVAVRDAQGNTHALLESAAAVAARFRDVGLRVELLRDRALAQAIAESWSPGLPERWTWPTADGRSEAVLAPAGAPDLSAAGDTPVVLPRSPSGAGSRNGHQSGSVSGSAAGAGINGKALS
jgi:hypothetical protein